jgi:hypothetical protein
MGYYHHKKSRPLPPRSAAQGIFPSAALRCTGRQRLVFRFPVKNGGFTVKKLGYNIWLVVSTPLKNISQLE